MELNTKKEIDISRQELILDIFENIKDWLSKRCSTIEGANYFQGKACGYITALYHMDLIERHEYDSETEKIDELYIKRKGELEKND